MKFHELTPSHIAEALGFERVAEAWHFARNIDGHFLPRESRLIKGKLREIDRPKKYCKKRLRKLHRFFQKNLAVHPAAHGGVAGRSCLTNAGQHCGKTVILTRDAENCYPSITTQMLRGRLRQLGLRSDTAKLLSQLMTVQGQVAQGSPLSSDALNLYFLPTDRDLAALSAARDATYGRVYDDFVISLDTQDAVEEIGAKMESAIEATGLRWSRRKKEQAGLQPGNVAQNVHNLVVNDPRGPSIPKQQREKALELATSYVRSCRSVTPDSLTAVAKKRQRLTGWIHHCRQARFSNHRHLRRLLEQGDQFVLARLKKEKLIPHKNKWWVISKKRNEPLRLANIWRRRMVDLAA